MKFIFLSPETDSLIIQYSGFSGKQDRELAIFEDYHRRTAKILNELHVPVMASNLIYKRHFEYTIGSILLKRGWNDRICFIMYGRIYESYGRSIVDFLRDRYRDCIIVCYFGDLVSRHMVSVKDAKKIFDKVYTFDKRDSRKYGITWLLEPFSSEILNYEDFVLSNKKWDVTFVGAEKGRYRKIIKMYEKFREAGLKCDFHITGVKKKDRVYVNEIGYSQLGFQDLLKHVADSACVAEIVQNGGFSPTTRFTEALLFKRNLLTDCEYFKKPENRTPNVFYFEKIEHISQDMMKEIRKQKDFKNASFVYDFSIERMIADIKREIDNSDIYEGKYEI